MAEGRRAPLPGLYRSSPRLLSSVDDSRRTAIASGGRREKGRNSDDLQVLTHHRNRRHGSREGVPTALSEGRLAGSPEQGGVSFFHANERATLAAQPISAVVSRPDSHDIVRQNGVEFFYANERATIGSGPVSTIVSRPDSHDIVRQAENGYIHASDRARRINTVVPTAYLDAHERSAPPAGSQPSSSDAAGSGSERDWSQLGIGLGLGLLLAVGLFLAMRMTRVRPLAH
jgi:hypothetical protein